MKKHFYLYIDETGSRLPDQKEKERNDSMNCFSFGGVLIQQSDKEKIKQDFFSLTKKWSIEYPLHSSKIRGARDKFIWLKDKDTKEVFLHDLENFLIKIPVIGFAVVVDRDGYNNRYKELYGNNRWSMCKTAYSILIERVAKYVSSIGGTFEVCFEECGKDADRKLLEYSKFLKNNGLPFSEESSKKYKGLMAEDFQKVFLGDPKRKKKDSIFTQIADLYLFPMAKSGYEKEYKPWLTFYRNKKIIDSILDDESAKYIGIKYSCFDK